MINPIKETEVTFLQEIVKRGLAQKLNALYDEEIERVKIRIESERASIINQVTVEFLKCVEYEVIGETLSIRIIKK